MLNIVSDNNFISTTIPPVTVSLVCLSVTANYLGTWSSRDVLKGDGSLIEREQRPPSGSIANNLAIPSSRSVTPRPLLAHLVNVSWRYTP